MEHSEFGQFYTETFKDVYRYALAMTRNRSAAEEITQEAFMRLFRGGVNGIRTPRAWLFRVARNLSLDHSKKIQTDSTFVLSATASRRSNPEQITYQHELHERILDALSRLSEAQRECITLREYGGLDYRSISEILGTSIDQVKVQLHRARQNLKKDLEDFL